jgi:hypothetical protein
MTAPAQEETLPGKFYRVIYGKVDARPITAFAATTRFATTAMGRTEWVPLDFNGAAAMVERNAEVAPAQSMARSAPIQWV